MYVCMNVMHVCMHACMYVCMHCLFVCLYVCMYIYLCTNKGICGNDYAVGRDMLLRLPLFASAEEWRGLRVPGEPCKIACSYVAEVLFGDLEVV